MASQFKEILGGKTYRSKYHKLYDQLTIVNVDMILMPEKSSREYLPSPEELRGKILLKVRAVSVQIFGHLLTLELGMDSSSLGR